MIPRGLLVTGTDTGVGKTIVAAVIARQHAAAGRRVAVFKPCLTGLADPGEPDHLMLRRAAGSDQPEQEIAPYRYGQAVSPHLASELSGVPIEPALLLDGARRAAGAADVLVVEGVGGFLVPITPGWLVRDLAIELELPVVIAARPGLGTINHTLLTLEAVRGAGLEARAVVLTPWPEAPSAVESSNQATITRLGGVETLCLSWIDPESPAGWPHLAGL